MGIHEDVQRGNIAAVAQALAEGAELEAREHYHGRTPLMVAARPQAGLEMVQLLLRHGADVNARSWTPETAPADAVAARGAESATYQFIGETALTLAASTGSIDVVRELLGAGADTQATTTHGYDALINAVYAGRALWPNLLALVELLLQHDAAPNRVTTYQETALKVASAFALFDVVSALLRAGAEPAQLGWDALMSAAVFGSLADLQAALPGADLAACDHAGRTALHLSIHAGQLEKAQAIRAAGGALAGSADKRPSPLSYAISPSHPRLLAWMLAEGCDPNAPNSYGATPLMEAAAAGSAEAVRLLLEAGARPTDLDEFGQGAIHAATDLEVIHELLAAGANLEDVSDEMRPALFGIAAGATLDATDEQYQAGKRRRFGAANPEPMDVPFWNAMIRTREIAYAARRQFEDNGSYGDSAVWCFKRFGRTLTALPDGRYVEVAGEHEDFYDPDFCIYNDVVVYSGDGSFTLYGYPEDVFPPTDFHTATLVGSQLYLIGSLGYQGTRRIGETPVYRLSSDTWRIERLDTWGQKPGWISRHSATYDAEGGRIVVRGGKRCVRRAEPGRSHTARKLTASGARKAAPHYVEDYQDNTQAYALDLASLVWSPLAE